VDTIDMDTIDMDIVELRDKRAKERKELSKFVSGGLLADILNDYERILEGIERETPFRKGDRVELASVIDFDKAHGWRCCAHFLGVGAKGAVHCTQMARIGWVVGVTFDDETWIGYDGKKHPVPAENRGLFFFHPSKLRRESTKDDAAPREAKPEAPAP